MARQGGHLPYPPTDSVTQEFPPASASSHRLSLPSTLYQSSIQGGAHFDNSFSSGRASFHSSLDHSLKAARQPSQISLSDHETILLSNNYQDFQSQTSAFLQDNTTTDLIPFTNVRHEPRVSPHEPWNPVDAVNPSFSANSGQPISNSEQAKHILHTDSGYASSRKSRHIQSFDLASKRSLEAAQSHPYDDPIGSAAQQNHLLPDQKQQRPTTTLVIPPASKQPSVNAGPASAVSGPQSFRCEECQEFFNVKSEMSKHMARHNKKFTCDHANCPRRTDGFATKNDLDRHKGSVHHDATVTRKEYRCSVPGCKDPTKVWDRKDNFKAHVKRMHQGTEAEIEAIVQSSYIDNNVRSSSRLGNQFTSQPQEYRSSMLTAQSPSIQVPQTQEFDAASFHENFSYNANIYGDDQFDPSVHEEVHQASYQPQIDLNAYTSTPYLNTPNNVLSATSYTMAPPTTPQDHVRTAMSVHKDYLSPVGYGKNVAHSNASRPIEVQTAPITGHGADDFQSHFPDMVQNSDARSVVDSMPQIDPSLQTLQSGGWAMASQPSSYPPQAEITDHQLSSTLTPTTDDQPATLQRQADLEQQLEDILKMCPPERQLEIMAGVLKRHNPPPKRSDSALETATPRSRNVDKGSVERPFTCTRDGCYKTFTQNNIRKKHEKRHDRSFFCTFDGCYSTFGSKNDLIRHEQKRHARQAFEGWRCFDFDVPTSQHRPACARFFHDKDKFEHHRREEHRERATANNGGLKALKYCYISQGRPGHFWCGFCDRVVLNDPTGTDGTKRDKFRYDHVDNHIQNEGKGMGDWIDLKSQGQSKREVKAQKSHLTGVQQIEESDDEEEGDESSPAMSATIGNSSIRGPGTANNHFHDYSVDNRKRKRARSDADSQQVRHVAKAPMTVANYVPRYAPSMARGVSDMAPAGSSSTSWYAFNNDRQSFGQITWVVCCHCGARRLHCTSNGCGNPGCFHPRCVRCGHFDNMMNSINVRSGAGPNQFTGT